MLATVSWRAEGTPIGIASAQHPRSIRAAPLPRAEARTSTWGKGVPWGPLFAPLLDREQQLTRLGLTLESLGTLLLWFIFLFLFLLALIGLVHCICNFWRCVLLIVFGQHFCGL